MKKQADRIINGDTLTRDERLDAVAWKARQQGLSYGKFTIGLTADERKQIYEEYAVALNTYMEMQRKFAETYRQSKKKKKCQSSE